MTFVNYRVWVESQQRFIYVPDDGDITFWSDDICQGATVTFKDGSPELRTTLEYVNPDSGMVDKYGRAVFENDIARCKNRAGKEIIGTVQWDHKQGAFFIMSDDNLLKHHKHIDIIGTTYTNEKID